MIKLGIIGPNSGAGQLGRFLALAANRLTCSLQAHISVQTISSNSVEDWTDEHFDLSEIDSFFKNTDLIIYETESISLELKEKLAEKLIPQAEILNQFSNRFQEKLFFRQLKIKIPEFYYLKNAENLKDVEGKTFGKQWRLKNCEGGYDGKGQLTLDKISFLKASWESLGGQECLLEEEVPIFRELSIISTRFKSGEIIHFPIPVNIYKRGILYRSRSPKISKKVQDKLKSTSKKILNKLNYIGTCAIEFFQLENEEGILLLNELAPRVHNSGHFSLEACNQDQFETHIKAICDLPCSEIELKFKYFSMTNLIGLTEEKFELLKQKFNNFIETEKLELEAVQYYWYHKSPARSLRKMGHLTICSNCEESLIKAENFLDELLSLTELCLT
jgi:5-(carboxyamino)imidazole ribonucleotide synthase